MGNYKNAYITKQPNAVDPSEWINKQEEIGNYYNELKAQKEKDKVTRDDATIKSDLDLKWDYESSGNATFDEFLAGAGDQMIPKFAQARQEAKEALIKYGQNSPEYNTARSKYTNIANIIPQFKMMYADTERGLEENKTLMATNNYVQHPDNIKSLNEFENGDYQFRINENGMARVKKGGVSLNEKDFQGLNLKKPIEKLYAKDIAEKLSEVWGKETIETRDGYIDYTKINNINDTKDPKTGEKVKGLRSSLTDYYELIVSEEDVERYFATEKNEFFEFDGKKISDNEAKNKKVEFIKNLVESTIPLIEKKTGQKFDSARYRVDSKNTKPTDKTTGITQALSKNKVRPTASVYGAKLSKKINSKNRWSVQPSKSVQIGNRTEQQLPTFNTIKDSESGDTYSNATIESYTYDDGGTLIAVISYVADKGRIVNGDQLRPDGTYDDKNTPEKKETAIITANTEVDRDIANFLGISIDDLQNMAIDKEDEQKEDKAEDKKEETKEERLARMKAAINTP